MSEENKLEDFGKVTEPIIKVPSWEPQIQIRRNYSGSICDGSVEYVYD